MSSKPFELCIVIDDDEDILLAARLLLRDLFADVVTTPSPQVSANSCPATNPRPCDQPVLKTLAMR